MEDQAANEPRVMTREELKELRQQQRDERARQNEPRVALVRKLRDEGKAVEANRELSKLMIDLLIEMMLVFRSHYLSNYPRQALTHWERIKSVMMSASRRSRTVTEWTTRVTRDLQLKTLGKEGSSIMSEVSKVIDDDLEEWAFARRVLDREMGAIEAGAREIAEQRSEENAARRATKEKVSHG